MRNARLASDFIFVGNRSGVIERERDRFSGCHYVRQADRQNAADNCYRARNAERFSVRPQHGIDPQILMKLHDDASRDLLRDEFHFGLAGDCLIVRMEQHFHLIVRSRGKESVRGACARAAVASARKRPARLEQE